MKNHCRRRAGKRQTARRHLIEDRAQREQIAARIEFLAASLLRRHVGDGADSGARAGEMCRAGRVLRGADSFHRHLAAGQLGESEVENLYLALCGEYVGGLDVAVDDALGVRGVERVGELNRHVEQRGKRHRTRGDFLVKALALEQFHRNECLALRSLDGVDRADIRMVQRRSRPRFQQKSIQRGLILQHLRRQEFQRHAPSQVQILRLVHDTHPPTAKAAGDAVVQDGLVDHELRDSGSSS